MTGSSGRSTTTRPGSGRWLWTAAGLRPRVRLLAGVHVQLGLETLRWHGRLDESVEAHVLLPRYEPLFTDDARRIARARLVDHGFDVDDFLAQRAPDAPAVYDEDRTAFHLSISASESPVSHARASTTAEAPFTGVTVGDDWRVARVKKGHRELNSARRIVRPVPSRSRPLS